MFQGFVELWRKKRTWARLVNFLQYAKHIDPGFGGLKRTLLSASERIIDDGLIPRFKVKSHVVVFVQPQAEVWS